MSLLLPLESLTKEAFLPFGDVIEIQGEPSFPINGGTTARYHDLGDIQVMGDDARAAISMARGDGFAFPIQLTLLERHPFGSQAWLPINGASFVVVVAPNGKDDKPDESRMRAFYAHNGQGVNYHAGTWHHPLLTHSETQAKGDFIVVDRIGDGNNCDEVKLTQSWLVTGEYR